MIPYDFNTFLILTTNKIQIFRSFKKNNISADSKNLWSQAL